MGLLNDGGYLRSKAIHEADVGKWHDECLVINRARVTVRAYFAVLGREEFDFSAPTLLGEPDLPHRRKLEFTHDDFSAFAKIESAGDGIDPGGRACDDCDFLGSSADEARKCSPRPFVFLDPAVPWRPVFVPGADVRLQRRFHGITQGPL